MGPALTFMVLTFWVVLCLLVVGDTFIKLVCK